MTGHLHNPCEIPACPHADEAAERAVKKVFAILGVDVEKPESVEEFREDLRFGKKLRRGADHGFLVMTAVIVTAVLAALWAGITSKLGH
jgi:hypothetical protein